MPGKRCGRSLHAASVIIGFQLFVLSKINIGVDVYSCLYRSLVLWFAVLKADLTCSTKTVFRATIRSGTCLQQRDIIGVFDGHPLPKSLMVAEESLIITNFVLVGQVLVANSKDMLAVLASRKLILRAMYEATLNWC